MEVDITTSVWADCLEIIKQNVDEQNFNTWFKPIEPVRTEGDVLTIQVPSQFFYEWLEENYVPVLKKAVRQVLGERSEEHTSELQSQFHLVCRLLLEKKKNIHCVT